VECMDFTEVSGVGLRGEQTSANTQGK